MSYKATNWAYELPVKGAPKNVLVALADMADEASQCYPGQKRIADMIGRSPKTVERALKWLEEHGLVSRVHRHGPNGFRTSDRYQLHTEITDLTDILPTSQPAYKAESLQGTVSRLTDTVTLPNRQGDGAIEPSVEPLVEPSDSYAPDIAAFDHFWAVWPRREGKAAAMKAWTKAIRKTYYGAIIAAATEYAEHPNRPAVQFVPYGASWLNGERWNDGPPTAPEQGRGKPTPEQRARQTLALASDLIDDPKGITA